MLYRRRFKRVTAKFALVLGLGADLGGIRGKSARRSVPKVGFGCGLGLVSARVGGGLEAVGGMACAGLHGVSPLRRLKREGRSAGCDAAFSFDLIF